MFSYLKTTQLIFNAKVLKEFLEDNGLFKNYSVNIQLGGWIEKEENLSQFKNYSVNIQQIKTDIKVPKNSYLKTTQLIFNKYK